MYEIDRTYLDESLHRAAALNRKRTCYYCSILLWNHLHIAFFTVVESTNISEKLALPFFRINITFLEYHSLLGYDAVRS
jgi:hypothetical protein